MYTYTLTHSLSLTHTHTLSLSQTHTQSTYLHPHPRPLILSRTNTHTHTQLDKLASLLEVQFAPIIHHALTFECEGDDVSIKSSKSSLSSDSNSLRKKTPNVTTGDGVLGI